jgi:hypothetical protein
MMDTEQIRALIQQSYALISGPAGPRDWDAHSRLYTPGARAIVIHRGSGTDRVESMTQDDYRRSRDPFFLAHSFWELEVSCDITIARDLASAMSHYESRWAEDGPAFETGTNSIQLVRVDGQWKIASIMWTAGKAAAEVSRLSS